MKYRPEIDGLRAAAVTSVVDVDTSCSLSLDRPKSTNWTIALCFVIFAIAFLASRLWLIESDLAPVAVADYVTIDEPFYVGTAFEWAFGRSEPPELMDKVSSIPNGLFFNAVTYVNLLLLGNTYYGLRLNVVILALIASLVFSYVLYLRFSISALIISLPIYLLTLPWFMASLVVEPTLYRLFHLSLYVALLYWLESRGKANTAVGIFCLSSLAYSGVLLVYFTNIFIVPATFVYYVLKAWRQRDGRLFARFCFSTLAALIASIVLWAMLSKLAFGGIEPTVTFLSALGDRTSFANGFHGLPAAFRDKFSLLFYFSFFSQTPFVFYVYAAGLLLMAWRLILSLFDKAVDGDARFSIEAAFSLLSLAFFSQTLFINDFPQRKLVFLCPFIIFAGLLLFEQVQKIFRVPSTLVSIAFALYLIIPSAIQADDLLFRNYSEGMKSAMVSLRSLGATRVCGGYSQAFRLYNRIKPCLMYYVYDYVLRDIPEYNAIMSGKYPDFAPEYSIGAIIENVASEEMWTSSGFEKEKTLLQGGERYERSVFLFRRRSPFQRDVN